MKSIDSALIISGPSRQLALSLSFVMLCTEMEIFIEHLIETILTSHPIKLKDCAPNKLRAQIPDVPDFNQVKALSHEVADRLLRKSTRDLFLGILSGKLNLFHEAELHAEGFREPWTLKEIEQAWAMRHAVVHDGDLPVTKEYFQTVNAGLIWLQVFLSLCARREYNLKIDDATYLDTFAEMFKIS